MENNTLLMAVVGAGVRAVAQAGAGAGFIISESLQGQIIAVMVGLASVVWSVYQKKKTVKK